MSGPYNLVASQIAHNAPLRSISLGPWEREILTGCQGDAPCVKRWQLSPEQDSFQEVGAPLYHDHWVTAITYLPVNESRPLYPKGCIVTGCMDSKIRVFDADGTLCQTLEGHNKGVISFSWTRDGSLVSGAWDGVAILWDLGSGQPILRFGPHENGVNVLCLPDGRLATTSTGEAVNGKPANFRLRFWDLLSGQQLGDSIEDHGGPIRSLIYLPYVQGMATTSNDGSVMLRSPDGVGLASLLHPVQDDGSLPMVLNCAALAGSGLASCGEDGSVCVWHGSDLVQSIPHPNTVWALLAIDQDQAGASFLTAGHDGVLRLFSKDPQLTSTSRVRRLTFDFVEEVETVIRQRKRGPSEEEVSKAPRWENRGSHPGRKEDDVMVFNQDGKLIAAQWSSGSWIVVGEVTSTGDGSYIDGVWFDHVFPVEIETSTGLRALKLGYNNGENPFVAAQRFINANNLDQYHLQQIADWILQRTQNSAPPTLGGSPTSTTSAAAQASRSVSSSASTRSFSRPISGYISFDDVPTNPQKVLAKIREGHTMHTVHLSAEQLAAVEASLLTLCDTAHFQTSSLPPLLLGAINIMIRWPVENRFVGYDLLRLVIAHPQGSEMLSTSPLCRTILQQTIDLLSQSAVPHSAALMACRCTVNMWKSEPLKRMFCTHFLNESRELLYACMRLASHPNKLVRSAAITVAYNLVAAITLSTSVSRVVITSDLLQETVRYSLQLLQAETEGGLAAGRAVQVLGTLLGKDDPMLVGLVPEVKACLASVIPVWAARGDQGEVVQMLEEVQRLVSQR